MITFNIRLGKLLRDLEFHNMEQMNSKLIKKTWLYGN
jgi:hypothetical protein